MIQNIKSSQTYLSNKKKQKQLKWQKTWAETWRKKYADVK